MVRARLCALSAAFVVASALLATSASADEARFGVRGGYYTDVEEPFLGAELLFRLAPRLYFNPNAEYVFVENGSLMTFNADFHYDFDVSRRSFVWLGGGLGIVRVDPEGENNGDTDPAANFLGGIGFRSGSVIPYFQAKLIAKSNTEFVIAFGIRF